MLAAVALAREIAALTPSNDYEKGEPQAMDIRVEIPEPGFARIHLYDDEPLMRIEAIIDQEGLVRIPGDITLNEVIKQRITNAVLAEYEKQHAGK